MKEEILELKEQITKGLSEVKSKVNDTTSKFKDELKKDVEALEEKFNKLGETSKDVEEQKELLKKMQSHLDSLDIKMQKKSNGTVAAKSFDSALEEKLADENIATKLQELKNNRSTSVNLEVKSAAAMTLSSYAGNALTTEVDTNVSKAPIATPLFRNITNVASISGNRVTWVNKEGKEGGAGMTGEGEKKSQVSWTYTEESADVKKITAFIKVSKEALDDLAFLRSEINTDLREEIELKLDEQLSEGDGSGNNLKGILNYAKDFSVSGTSFDKSVDFANRLDVLRVAIAIVRSNRYNANYAVLNPNDAALMELTKGEDGHYILPPFTTADGTKIKSVTVIENDSVDEGSFLVGDFTKSNLRIREEININLGYENDDFTKNMITILAEMRAVHYVKKHHIDAFVKGSFDTAITSITKAGV